MRRNTFNLLMLLLASGLSLGLRANPVDVRTARQVGAKFVNALTATEVSLTAPAVNLAETPIVLSPGWTGSLTTLEPGKGYMYLSRNTGPVLLYYPVGRKE